jgi:hypothetical protein
MSSLADLLADLEAKVAFHRRQEGLCAEQEALFRERRSFHAAELERISQPHWLDIQPNVRSAGAY